MNTFERRRALIADTYRLVAMTRRMSAVQQIELWGAVYWPYAS